MGGGADTAGYDTGGWVWTTTGAGISAALKCTIQQVIKPTEINGVMVHTSTRIPASTQSKSYMPSLIENTQTSQSKGVWDTLYYTSLFLPSKQLRSISFLSFIRIMYDRMYMQSIIYKATDVLSVWMHPHLFIITRSALTLLLVDYTDSTSTCTSW